MLQVTVSESTKVQIFRDMSKFMDLVVVPCFYNYFMGLKGAKEYVPLSQKKRELKLKGGSSKLININTFSCNTQITYGTPCHQMLTSMNSVNFKDK